jgi:hypothetical protein
MAKAGRPNKDFDKKQFESLCEIMCTQSEICSILGTTDKTLVKWCKRTYKMDFSECFKRFSASGKMSLRRKQFEVARSGNVSMLIWLGKQYLGQTEKVENTNIDVDPELQSEFNNFLEE